jgi:hypothetical protein
VRLAFRASATHTLRGNCQGVPWVSAGRCRLSAGRRTGAAGAHIFPVIAKLAIAKTPKGAHRGVGDTIKMILFFGVSELTTSR